MSNISPRNEIKPAKGIKINIPEKVYFIYIKIYSIQQILKIYHKMFQNFI